MTIPGEAYICTVGRVREEPSKAVTWWYLSFANSDAFLGACIVEGEDEDGGFIDAVLQSKRLGCNPGGQVVGSEVPDGQLPDPSYRNRLLTEKEVNALWPDSKKAKDLK